MALITWAEVIERYPSITDIGSDTQVGSAWIGASIAELNSRLATAFTVPFSSNNETAKDLAIEMVYLRIQRSRDSDISEALNEAMDARIKGLLEGKAAMLTVDGTVLSPSGGVGDVWSNTDDYHPVFGMGDETHFHVDSSQVYDEAIARGEVV